MLRVSIMTDVAQSATRSLPRFQRQATTWSDSGPAPHAEHQPARTTSAPASASTKRSVHRRLACQIAALVCQRCRGRSAGSATEKLGALAHLVVRCKARLVQEGRALGAPPFRHGEGQPALRTSRRRRLRGDAQPRHGARLHTRICRPTAETSAVAVAEGPQAVEAAFCADPAYASQARDADEEVEVAEERQEAPLAYAGSQPGPGPELVTDGQTLHGYLRPDVVVGTQTAAARA